MDKLKKNLGTGNRVWISNVLIRISEEKHGRKKTLKKQWLTFSGIDERQHSDSECPVNPKQRMKINFHWDTL